MPNNPASRRAATARVVTPAANSANKIVRGAALSAAIPSAANPTPQEQLVPPTAGGPPTGPAGGDLAGSYPNPTVAKIQGRAVSTASPLVGAPLKWVPSTSPKWAPGSVDVYNVADYGAVPNSSGAAAANDTAIAAAITALLAGGNGTLYFPQGIWFISALISVVLPNPGPGSVPLGITITSDGPSSCIILQTSANTGVFSITVEYAFTQCEISRMRIGHNSATANSTASAILVTTNTSSAPTSAWNNGLVCTDLSIGETGGSTTFAKNIEVNGMANVYFTRCNLAHVSAIGIGIYAGLNPNGVANIGVTLQDCCLSGFATAVQGVSGPGGGGQIQGLNIHDCVITGGTVGVECDSQVSLWVTGSNITASSYVIHLTAANGAAAQNVIVGNFLSPTGTDDGLYGPWSVSTISGNIFVMGNAANSAIHLTSGAFGNAIVGNAFGFGGGASAGVGVTMDSGATFNVMNSSAFSGNFANKFVNSGGGTNSIGAAIP